MRSLDLLNPNPIKVVRQDGWKRSKGPMCAMTQLPGPSPIRIRGARQHNLVGVDVDIPRHALVVVTGVSGSGKSSLAFDTLFREGQRRFLETLSSYARQFLGDLRQPDVDSIEGLAPAIAVDQRSVPRGSRSTVGTLTEITDHLRILYARAGTAYCPGCDEPVTSRTPEALVQEILDAHAGDAIQIGAPVIRSRKGHHQGVFEDLRKRGFVRARVDGVIHRLEEVPELGRYKLHDIEVIVDRLRPSSGTLARLRESVQQALDVGAGDLLLIAGEEVRLLSTQRTCPSCGDDVPPLEPRLFSFNSSVGACPGCSGHGERRQASERSVVADRTLTIREGALAVTRSKGGALLFPRADFAFLEKVAKAHDFDLDTPWKDLGTSARRVILRGANAKKRFEDKSSWAGQKSSGSVVWKRRWKGVIPALDRARERGTRRKMVDRFLAVEPCGDCQGARIAPAPRAVRVAGVRMPELTGLPVDQLPAALKALKLDRREARIGRDVLSEIQRRLTFLLQVGLGYLSLDRAADTLSGGEAQRIRLAAQLGAGLRGVLYVLDEPSIGLHARDHAKLLEALRGLRDLGNSVVVVEHDEATLRAADWVVDVGPGAGRHGGEIVAFGPPHEVAKADTPTGRLLRGESLTVPRANRRPGNGQFLRLTGARAFNLKDVDLTIALGTLTAVTGVSGSGKSTLIQHTLRPAMERHLGREVADPGEHDALEGQAAIDDLVVVDASPIGRTPRSNPATYTKVLTPIRDLFASLPEARLRGYTKSHFSFNVAAGRCEACLGAGAKQVELQFLAPVTVPCDECGGHRFQEQLLDVTYKGHSIADVLALPAEEALELFDGHTLITRPLALMVEVGLGYLTLGQPSTTISGGEAQRLKLVSHLSKRPRGQVLYLLDEPTTGLHHDDVARLEGALQRLVDGGHTVVVIEHNLDLVAAADQVVDLGPEGGVGGGRIQALGTPEEIEACQSSYTGAALREIAKQRRGKKSAAKGKIKRKSNSRAKKSELIEVRGARTHNLAGVDVDLPRGAMTVISGPSGSGKSSLAMDTIHAEGRRRFVESLSTYARQFLGLRDRPPFDSIEGLGPSVAVEAGAGGAQRRSTIATSTELHDQLRVLYARAGIFRCPEHGQKLTPRDAAGVTRSILTDCAGLSKPKGWLLAPITDQLPASDKRAEILEARRAEWTTAGFLRLLADGEELRLDGDLEPLVSAEQIDLVVDRVAFNASSKARMADGVEQAAALAHGRVSVLIKGGARLEYSTRGACTQCGFQLSAPMEPRHFSFNTVVGACSDCHGLGARPVCDVNLLIAHWDRSVLEGALAEPFPRYLVRGKGFHEHLLKEVARVHRIDLSKPLNKLSQKKRDLLLHGLGAKQEYTVQIKKNWKTAELEQRFRAEWTGLCGQIDRWSARSEDPSWRERLERVMVEQTCPTCSGERLSRAARAVTVGKKRLPEILALDVDRALEFVRKLHIPGARKAVLGPIQAELLARLSMLQQVGLGYLTLDRSTGTLSGGEARRVRLSAALGSELVGVLYVLDEPTVGLHPADVDQLVEALHRLRDRGNTLLVVEHDAAVIRAADWVVDMGPGAGELGGQVVAAGTPAQVARSKRGSTGELLRGEIDLVASVQALELQAEPIPPSEPIRLIGARQFNLRGVDLEVHYGRMLGLLGPSGAGKSTLAVECLVPALRGEEPEGRWQEIQNTEASTRVVLVDATPIGRSPHSVPATYAGVLPGLRELYARTPDARRLGFTQSYFSFNSSRGRCPACDGRGSSQVEMQFLADIWLVCEECEGKRYRPEVLEVRWRGMTIAEALALSVDSACEVFGHQSSIHGPLASLQQVGLGYLRLDQSSTTLSGGEAQRLKLAAELLKAEHGGRSVLVLDEPTTGLAACDLVHLARALKRLVLLGNAVVLVEHQMDLLLLCDDLVELGPGGGSSGGRAIATGTPQEICHNAQSVSGPYLLRNTLPVASPSPKKKARKARKKPRPKQTRGSKA
ncbi:MAG TPA: excinuclease ABC subunit UvrA [Planctomycetes bacterium]|nr:excinuclease ABC subunit UvrA [Planctomycetota bacterium]